MAVPSRESASKVTKKVASKVTKKTASKPAVVGGDAGEPIAGGEGAFVHVQVGKTINLGDYETLRVDYGERHPVNAGETFDDVRTRARDSVESGLEKLIDDMKATFGG